MKVQIKSALALSAGVVAVVGLVLSPVVAGAASQTANTVINAKVAPMISISTLSTVWLGDSVTGIVPVSGGQAASGHDTVTVSTNNATGYNLKLADSDATVTMTGTPGGTIAATTGTFASPAALTLNSWGYRVDGVGTFGAGPTSDTATSGVALGSLGGTWAKLATGAGDQIKNYTTGAVTNDTTTVNYAFNADTTIPTGTFTDTVTYTAATNP